MRPLMSALKLYCACIPLRMGPAEMVRNALLHKGNISCNIARCLRRFGSLVHHGLMAAWGSAEWSEPSGRTTAPSRRDGQSMSIRSDHTARIEEPAHGADKQQDKILEQDEVTANLLKLGLPVLEGKRMLGQTRLYVRTWRT